MLCARYFLFCQVSVIGSLLEPFQYGTKIILKMDPFNVFRSVNLGGSTQILLDPLSERSRRHLLKNEIPEVKRGLLLRLQELCQEKKDRESAELAWRAYIRLSSNKPGRPKYPGFIWGQVQYYVDKFLDEGN